MTGICRCLLLLLLVSCTPGYRYTVKEANDIFSNRNRDRDFSQGLEILAESNGHEIYGRQLIYTPSDKRLTTPLPTERPYSGYLGGGYRRHSEDLTLGVELGIVGPSSYAEQSQSEFHRLIGDNVPKGWDHQLRDEPLLLLMAERRNTIALTDRLALLPVIGTHLGNMITQGYGGGMLRYGGQMSDPIFPRLPRRSVDNRLRTSVFAGVLQRAVAHTIFLDGNTFKDSPSVEREVFVLEGRAGFAVQYHAYRVTYTYIKMSREYETEERGMNFGELSFSWGY